MKKEIEVKPELADIKEGDRVWVNLHRGPGRIETVTKANSKEIVLGSRRFRRIDGKEIKRGVHLRDRINRIATSEECEKWDAEQEALRQQTKAKQDERDRKEAKRRELRSLFDTATLEEASGHITGTEGKWELTLWLDEEGVRRLAEFLKTKENSHD